MKILENPRNHSFFETTQLHDAGEFANFEICYHYLLPEIHPFLGFLRHEHHRTSFEIARENTFETDFGTSGDAHRPTIWVPKSARRRRAEKIRSPFWDPDTEILKYNTFGTHLGPKKRAPKARENFWSPFLGPIWVPKNEILVLLKQKKTLT